MLPVFVVFCLFATSTASYQNEGRIYDPLERDGYKTSYVSYTDDNGQFIYEDLTPDSVDQIMTESAQMASVDVVSIYLYTSSNVDQGESFKIADLSGLINSKYFSPLRQNVFIIHGWRNSYSSDVNILIKNALLSLYDVNVFVVDWSSLANQFYVVARYAVPDIGVHVGNFINQMMDEYELKSYQFNLIGHSLGAHICGAAGSTINGLANYIVGMDPAAPLFSLDDRDGRLDERDAAFVQVIHTNGGKLGLNSAIGHSDYYPNGGGSQPGCYMDITGSCSHSKSYKYFAESIVHPNFISYLCEDMDNFNLKACFNNERSYMGAFDIDKSASGDYFLTTNENEPYALGDVE